MAPDPTAIDHDVSPHPGEVGRREVARLGPVVVHEPHVGVGESARQEEHGLHREGHNSEGDVRPGRRRESSPSIPFEPFSRVSCFGFPIENSARISSSIPQARTCGSPTGPWKRGRRTDAGAAAREGRDPGEPAFDEVPSGQLRGPQPLPSDEHLPGRAVFDNEREPCGRQGTPFASFSSHFVPRISPEPGLAFHPVRNGVRRRTERGASRPLGAGK